MTETTALNESFEACGDDDWLALRRERNLRRLAPRERPDGVKPMSPRQAMTAITELGRVVYAMSIDDCMVKIGYTGNLYTRWLKLGGVASGAKVLGFTYGSWDLEQEVHASLIPYRALRHEYYHPVPEVLAVVNKWRASLGRRDPLTVENWLQ